MEKPKRAATSIIFYYIFLVGMLIISFYFLYDAFLAYNLGDLETAGLYSVMGLIGIGMAVYMVTILKGRTFTRKIPPKIFSVVECKKCGLKNIRRFMKDDFALKNVEKCSKCNESMIISSIYAEKVKK